MRLTLNHSVCTAISAAPILLIQTPLPTALQEYIFLQLKIITTK